MLLNVLKENEFVCKHEFALVQCQDSQSFVAGGFFGGSPLSGQGLKAQKWCLTSASSFQISPTRQGRIAVRGTMQIPFYLGVTGRVYLLLSGIFQTSLSYQPQIFPLLDKSVE